jgi:hypothetical protein
LPPLPVDPDGGTPVPHGGGSPCGFDLQAIALPAVGAVQGAPFPSLSGSTACASSSAQLGHVLADMDGDTLADLVVTSACDDASVGVTSWRVYPNTGTAFGPFVSYALPGAVQTPGCAQLALADVDGDRKLDLVVTSLCTDVSVGTTQWLVFRNTGGAFASAGQSFALPPNAFTHAFASLEVDAPNCGNGQPAYAFFDVNGDLKPDFVETSACDDVSVGVTYWRVFPGDGTGTGAASAFALPGGALFASPSGGEMSCTGALTAPRYAVVDVDGDLAPDLLVTSRCNDAVTGSLQWLVYANGKTAFASQPTTVALPSYAGAPSGAFGSLTGSATCGSGAFTHAFTDVDGDLKPDLVVTSACGDPTVGVGEWLVHAGTGSGFAAPLAYALPVALGATSASPVTALSGALSCNGAQHPSFGATHLLGLETDLVVTQTCTDPSVGTSRWLAFRPSKCSP